MRDQLRAAAAAASAQARLGEQVFSGPLRRLPRGARHARPAASLGPDLTHLMSRRTLAAGTLPNTPGNLAGWIADPQAIKPGAQMPALDLSGPELSAVVAYLETLQ